MTRSLLIGIHGLLNKPAADVLEPWWSEAIREGLLRNCGVADTPLFRLAYWADVRNENPIPIAELEERYEPVPATVALRRYDPDLTDRVRAIASKWGGRLIDKAKDLIGLGPGVEKIMAIKLGDLSDYYDSEAIRRRIRDRLRTLLVEHRDDRVLLIAHSMGTIIAHDVLRELEGDGAIVVEHLITIGSPLGLPVVGLKTREEFGSMRTPTTVRRWTNVADPRDKVSLDCNLADEFEPNDSGVKVTDVLVYDDYANHEGRPNPHKSYGYLRTPEVSDLIRPFLAGP